MRTVLRRKGSDNDLVARLQRVPGPAAVPDQRVWALEFQFPIRDNSLLVFYIDIETDVRVGPFEFRDHTLGRDSVYLARMSRSSPCEKI